MAHELMQVPDSVTPAVNGIPSGEGAKLLYISGPMTGLPECNYPAFFEAEELLLAAGYATCNPARLRRRPDWEWTDYMKASVRAITYCHGVALLPGWHESTGARVEFELCAGLKLPVWDLSSWLEKTIAEAA